MATVAAFNVKIGANVTEFMRKVNQVERAINRLERSRHGVIRLKVVEDLDRAGANFRRNMAAARKEIAGIANEVRAATRVVATSRTRHVTSKGNTGDKVTHVLASTSDALDLGPVGYFGARAIGGVVRTGARGGLIGGAILTAGVGSAAVASIPFISAIPGAQFEYAMDRIRAKAGDAEPAILALQKRILDLGAASTLSAREVAAAAEEMAAMGFSAREIMQALPGVIAAAEATGEDLGIVMTTVAEALNNFELEASEASRVADVLAEAANASAANIETMHYVMKYAAPTAKQLGMEIEDLAAAAMILADRGLEASQIGRYLRMGLSRLASPTKQAKALMRELGIEVFDAHGKLKPFPEVIRELKTAFDKLTPAQAQAAAKTIFGTEAMTAFLMLIDEGPEKLAKYIKQLENATGAADKMAKTLRDNLLMDLEELGGELETLAIYIFGENVGWMRAGVRAATNFFEGITKAFEAKQKPSGVPLGKANVLIGEGVEDRYLQGYRESWLTTIVRGIFGDGSVATQIAAALERDDWYSVGSAIGNGLREAVTSIDYAGLARTVAYKFGEHLSNTKVNAKSFFEGFFEGLGVPDNWAEGLSEIFSMPTLGPIGPLYTFITKMREGFETAKEKAREFIQTFQGISEGARVTGGYIQESIVQRVMRIREGFEEVRNRIYGLLEPLTGVFNRANDFVARIQDLIGILRYVGSMIQDVVSGNLVRAGKRAAVLNGLLKEKIPPGKLSSALKEAERLLNQGYSVNEVLGKTLTKYVNVVYRSYYSPQGGVFDPRSGHRRVGGYIRHGGGLVPRVAHSGMVVPGAGTIPMRLWGGEMVITRGQQAQLLNLLRYGFVGNGPSGQASGQGGGTTYNITVNARTADIDEQEMTRILRRMEMLA